MIESYLGNRQMYAGKLSSYELRHNFRDQDLHHYLLIILGLIVTSKQFINMIQDLIF